ncbi:MAG: enoyl-CoA hydratase/isomerase family protein [Lautropia sp.]
MGKAKTSADRPQAGPLHEPQATQVERRGSMAFAERAGSDGARIGIARLDRAAQLNALNLEMCETMLAQFRRWASDESIRAVFLAGEGEKGFSAGGDVAEVSRQNRSGRPDRYAYGDAFFAVEYTLNLLMHTYPKPLVTWAHGVTMGGGLGLSVAGSHRFVTTKSRIAMPEIHIALFPDVGGGWFLNRVPGEAGLLLALTGIVVNEQDAVFARLADHVVRHERQDAFLDGLAALEWGRSARDDRARVSRFCREFEAAEPLAPDEIAPGTLRDRHDRIRSIFTRATMAGILRGLQEAAMSDPWFERAYRNLADGSPTGAAVSLEYLRRCRHLGLREVLDLDLVVAKQCQRHHDFPEGVRALLIDKDRKPRWQPANAGDVDQALVDGFFVAP